MHSPSLPQPIVLGPTPRTYVVVRTIRQGHKEYSPGDAFADASTLPTELADLIESGAIRPAEPSPLADRPIEVPMDLLLEARDCAFSVHGQPPPVATLFERDERTVRACFEQGLIGVSPPMLEVMARVGMYGAGDDPVLIRGEQGTEQEAVARALHSLGEQADCGFESVSCLNTRRLGELLYGAEEQRPHQGTLLIKDIEHAHMDDHAGIVALIERCRPNVLAATHMSLDTLERASRAASFSRDLLERLTFRTIQLPPLCLRPGDLPLWFCYVILRYGRGHYGLSELPVDLELPLGAPMIVDVDDDEPAEFPGWQRSWQVLATSVEALYVAASHRWPGNVDEFERVAVEACNTARAEGILPWMLHLDVTAERELPFGPGAKAFRQAYFGSDISPRSGPDLVDEPVLVEDGELLVYDLKHLMQIVDRHAEDPRQRGLWTPEARQRQLEAEAAPDYPVQVPRRASEVLHKHREEPDGIASTAPTASRGLADGEMASLLGGRPYAERLEEFLRTLGDSDGNSPHCWANDENHHALEVISSMVWESEVDLVKRFAEKAGAHDRAFELYWRSCLHSDARRLLTKVALSKDERREFELSKTFAELGIFGHSQPMRALYRDVLALAQGIGQYPDILPNVLIRGGIGTGKGLIAQAIHTLSKRDGGWRIQNCATLGGDPDMANSALFGHVKGAYTGATGDREGVFDACAGGTLFLDEVDKLPSQTQGLLLTVLAERVFNRVGDSGQPRMADVLVVAASNQDLTDRAEKKEFLPDLLSRLAGTEIVVPLLAERVDDVPLLVSRFLLPFRTSRLARVRHELALAIRLELSETGFPEGNVRWLESEVGRLARRTSISAPPDDAESYQQIQRACDALEREHHQRPHPLYQVARMIGKSDTYLYDPPARWQGAVARAQQEGLLKTPKRRPDGQ